MRVSPFVISLPLAGRLLAAQCPNGSPPPCVRERASTPDPGRIAVFPFHVTTADSLLGEGVAELVAGELTGEGGPRAIHMGTALRTWRRAGGGLRTPLGHVEVMRAATELGAGLVLEGSVVGLGQRLTLSAQIVSVPSGTARRVAPISGLADSLPVLIERLTAGVLAASGASVRVAPQRLSDSPAAVRAYMEGLAAFRRGRFVAAADRFDRAIAFDTLFTRATFMRWMTATWGPGLGSESARQAARRARAQRARLSLDDQNVLDAAFGDLARKERAATVAPESPEVLYFLGDHLYHGASRLGWEGPLARAQKAFEQSAALDSQSTVLHHLVEIGLWTRDTSLLRRAWRAYDRLVEGADPTLGWLVAARTGDARLVADLRRRIVPNGSEDDYVRAFFGLAQGPGILSPAVVEELTARTARAVVPRLLPNLRLWHLYILSLQGRAADAARVAQEGPVADSVLTDGFRPDLWFAAAALIGDGDWTSGAAAVARLRAGRPREPDVDARTSCAVRLWDAVMRDSVVPDDGLLRRHGQRACAELLDVMSAQRLHQGDQTLRLARADSVVRDNAVLFNHSGVGHVLLARCWEAVGDRSRALELLRLWGLGLPDWSLAVRRRTEGRLTALEGDTAAAVRAYQEYLDLRRNADPEFMAQRDSVRAELARLAPNR